MVEPDLFRNRVKTILPQEYELEFLGEKFDLIVNSLSDAKAEKIYEWARNVASRCVQPIFIGSKKKYKGVPLYELMTFRYPFQTDNIHYRILLIKIKNSIYLEFHLGDHKYYDKVRKDLSLTQN